MFLFLFCFFQSKDKFSSDAFSTDDINGLVVSVDDFFDDRKSKSCAFAVFSTGGVDFVEAFPDFIQAFFRDAGTVVFDRDENFSAFYGGLYLDGRIIMAEFDGIVQKIIENLLDLFHICPDIEFMSGQEQFQTDLAAGADAFERSCGVFDCIVDVETVNVHHTFFHVQFVQCEQTAG